MVQGSTTLIINKNNNLINNEVVQVENLLVKNYNANYIFQFQAVTTSAVEELNVDYFFDIIGERVKVTVYQKGTLTQNDIIFNFFSIYSALFRYIDNKYNTSLYLNFCNTNFNIVTTSGSTVLLVTNCFMNPYYDYCTKKRNSNFEFARKMFTSYSNFDSVLQSPNAKFQDLIFRINSVLPYDLTSPFLSLFNYSLNDLKNLYSNVTDNLQNSYTFNLISSLIISGIFSGGGTITQEQFNALLATSNLDTLNDTYLKKKNYLTCNGSASGRNRYIGRYALLETTANFIINVGGVEIDKANFPVNTNKTTDTTFFVSDPTITYKLSAGVYKVTIRLEFTATGTTYSPIIFFQFSTSPTIQGLQTLESNSSINKPSTIVKGSSGDADTYYCERVLSLSADSFMYLTAYSNTANTIFYAGQCQIYIEKIAENS